MFYVTKKFNSDHVVRLVMRKPDKYARSVWG